MPDFDIGASSLNRPTGGGLFSFLDPEYQLAQQKVALARQQVQQSTLFQDGLPTDPNTGQTDYGAAYNKAMQAGAYDLANNLVSTGIRMRSLNDNSTLDHPTGAPAGGAGLVAQPAAGGAAAGGGNAGTGQVGAGGAGAPAAGSFVGPGGGSTNGVEPMDAYAHSIGTIESSNRYDALGPKQANGSQGIGRYQVMTQNVGPWTQEVLGQAMSPEDFRANPQAQDAVFRAKFGQAVQQYGSPFDAASVWFSGKPLNRAGNAADSLGTTVPSYVKKFAAGLGPAAAALRGGQGGFQPGAAPQAGAQPAPAPGGGLISFNSPTGAPATPASQAGSGPSPIAAAQARLAAQQNADLDTLTPEQNAQRDADVDTVQQAGAAAQGSAPQPTENGAAVAPVLGRPAPPADVMAAINRMKSNQGTQADKALYVSWASTSAPGRAASGGTVNGAPAPADDAPVGGDHPYGPSGPGMAGGVNSGRGPGMAPASPGGAAMPPAGVQPISFGGPAGGAPAMASGGGAPPAPGGGAPAARPAPVQAPPVVGGGATSPASGPDLPNLPAGFQDPGGGTRYVNAVLAKAAQFATADDPRAKVWEARANQIQAQLVAAQGFKNNLALAQARADDRFNAANSPGAIAAAGAKAGAETTARNALSLVPSVQPDGSTIMIPQSDALASAQAGKPIVSAQSGYVTQGQANLQTKLSDGSKAYEERQVASQRLDALSSLLETYQTGANSTAFNTAAANARSIGITVPTSATLNTAAMQEFAKDGYANVLSTMREQGNKQYQAEVSAAINSNPNPDLQPEANAAMIAQMQGTKRWYDQNFRDYSQWYHGNKGASDDADFQTSWTDAHPLGAYVAAAGKDIAPAGVQVSSDPSKLIDGQAYQTAGGKMRWSASAGRMVPFGGPTAPALPGEAPQRGGRQGQAQGGQPQSTPPISGARQAPNGRWYAPDPNRPGKYLMVAN